MLPKIAFPVPILLSSLFAQGPEATVAETPALRTDITENAGLQPDGHERLLGGGADYRAHFTRGSVRFVPALGRAAPTTQHLELRPESVRRGALAVVAGPLSAAPLLDGLVVRCAHAPGVEERYAVGIDGVELSWRIDEQPAGEGDLVVRYSVATSLPAPHVTAAGGLEFVLPEVGGVTIGAVTGIDARGATVAGGVSWSTGGLELSLPASFVDAATYPIVLDPLIGAKINVDVSTWNDSEPDTAYDASTDMYLVTFMRTFSTGESWPRAQRVGGNGALVGSTIFFNAAGDCGRARVANLPSRDRFGVVWQQQDGIFDGILFAAVDAATGTISHTSVVASSTGVQLYLDPDIGSSSTEPALNDRAFVVVFEDNIQEEIRARRVYFNSLDQLVSPSPYTLFADTSGPFAASYSQAAISRSSGQTEELLVAARRYSGIGPFISIYVVAITTYGTLLGPVASLAGSQTSLTVPDVDGQYGKWVVAWQVNGASGPTVQHRSVAFAASGSGYDLGATHTTGGPPSAQASAPTLGYTPGRTWLGYRQVQPQASPSTHLIARAIDSNTGDFCSDSFLEPMSTADSRIVVATATSGGSTSGEGALCVFGESNHIYAQRLQNYGTSGSLTNLGGGCGAGGSQSFSHSPGIGSSGLVCSVGGLPPTALATIFNLSPPTSPLSCGPCVWTPFSVTQTPGIAGGNASVQFPIPCLNSLVGAQLEVQWTTIDFSQAPCVLLPGLVLSDRWRMTLGR
jgi:hypothetical protein